MSKPSPLRVRNRLLARLPAPEYEHLSPHLKSVALPINQVLVEAHCAD